MASAARVAPRLIVFSDTTRVDAALMLARFTALAERAQAARVLFILRDYGLSLRARWALGERMSGLASRTEQCFGVAERADLARAWACSAFHLPAHGLRAAEARRYLGPNVFLSRGSHDPASEPEAELDALLISPIFAARKGRPALGVAALAPAPGALPARFALGGVDAHNAAACLATRAAGVAVIGAALAPDPQPLLAALGILRG